MATSSSFPSPLASMDMSILATIGWNKQPHILRSRWHMWYHNTINKDYNKQSFVDLFPKPIESLEELILLFNTWDEALPESNQGMFYMMREMTTGPIYPCREDPYNSKGGYWTCKIDTDQATEVWKKLCFLMVNEQVVEDWKKINGVSITPKHGFCLVKIWNRLDDECDVTQLKTYMSNFLDLDKVMYFNNKIKIAIDSKRQRGPVTQRPSHRERKPIHQKPPMKIMKNTVKQGTTSSPFGGGRTQSNITRGSRSSHGGGWRSLLQQQTKSTKPSQIAAGFYKPPIKTTKF